MADFRKDSLSEFLRPSSPPTKGGFAPPAPGVEELIAQIGSQARSPAPRTAVGPEEIMVYLRAHGPMAPAALLDAVGLALGPGLEALDRLERFGLIARETLDGAVVLRAAG